MQYALISVSDIIPMITAISTIEVSPFVRAPLLEPVNIMKALDAGSYAVIYPMINILEVAERFIAYCRYAPQ